MACTRGSLLVLLAALVRHALGGVDTSDSVAWAGTISFTGTASCEGARESVRSSLVQQLAVDAAAVDVLVPELSTGDNCTGAETHTDTFRLHYVFIDGTGNYGAEDADTVAADAKPKALDGVEGLEQVSSIAEFQPFERISGSLQFAGEQNCTEAATTTTEKAIAAVLGTSSIWVMVECKSDNSLAFTVSAAAAISSEEDGAYRADAVGSALDSSLAAKMKELGTTGELASITISDFDAGDNEAPSVAFVKGEISFKTTDKSCADARTATVGSLMWVFSLPESQVKVDDVCAEHAAAEASGSPSPMLWHFPFEIIHDTIEPQEVEEFMERMESHLSDRDVEAFLTDVLKTGANATEIAFQRKVVSNVLDSSTDAPEKGNDEKQHFREELSSAAMGILTFDVAATCLEVETHVLTSIALALKISTTSVNVESSKNCDEGAIQEVSQKYVDYWVVVPASLYGSEDEQVIKQALVEILPSVLFSTFHTAGFRLPEGDEYTVAVTAEHQSIELVKGSMNMALPDATCGQVISATTMALAETLKLRSIYVNARVTSCASAEAKFGAGRRLLTAAVSAPTLVEFNITLPARTETLDQEIYRADHVEKALQAASFEPTLLKALKETVGTEIFSELQLSLDAVKIEGFTNPEVDDEGVEKTTTTTTTTSTTEPPYSKKTHTTTEASGTLPEGGEETLAPDAERSSTSTYPSEGAEETMAPAGQDPFPHHTTTPSASATDGEDAVSEDASAAGSKTGGSKHRGTVFMVVIICGLVSVAGYFFVTGGRPAARQAESDFEMSRL